MHTFFAGQHMISPATTDKVHHYTLRTLEEIFDLAQTLSQYFSHPEQVMTGIYELLLNAVEHGNLGIGAKSKDRLIREGRWEAEVNHRLSQPRYASKEVKISLTEGKTGCRLVIRDQGKGFDWKKCLKEEIDLRNPRGRGLLIAQKAGFDHLEFNEAGNAVTCISLVCRP